MAGAEEGLSQIEAGPVALQRRRLTAAAAQDAGAEVERKGDFLLQPKRSQVTGGNARIDSLLLPEYRKGGAARSSDLLALVYVITGPDIEDAVGSSGV